MTISEQIAEYLRTEILRGRWSGSLPGKHQLANELGVNNKTVEVALRQLEKAGIIASKGAGRRRTIPPQSGSEIKGLRIAFLLNEGELDLQTAYHAELHHALTEAGHTMLYAPKSLVELRFDPKRVATLVRQTHADAWIVSAGSRGILEWFSAQPAPALAMFGHRIGVRIASVGPNKEAAFADATQHLIDLGHQRIALLCRRLRRVPQPGASETAFLDTLQAHGISVSDYNMPDWDDTPGDFRRCLEALFCITPPTALIIEEASYYVAVLQFLAHQGIRIPADVSLVCTDDDPTFAHCQPPVACIAWDSRPIVRRIVTWAANVSRGKPDLRLTNTPAKFIPGGTIGPVGKPRRR